MKKSKKYPLPPLGGGYMVRPPGMCHGPVNLVGGVLVNVLETDKHRVLLWTREGVIDLTPKEFHTCFEPIRKFHPTECILGKKKKKKKYKPTMVEILMSSPW